MRPDAALAAIFTIALVVEMNVRFLAAKMSEDR
jgi:hypothetical protein